MAKDTLSALLDGECSAGELDRFLDEMERSPELKTAWSRLCLARDAAEGVRMTKDQPCICTGVMQQIKADPQRSSARVFAFARPRIRGYWKPLAGLAAAASVAAVAFSLNFGGREAMDPTPGMGTVQVATPVSAPGQVRRPKYLQTVSANPADVQRAVFDEDLRNFLLEHSNTLTDRGMGATMSYARFAAHTVDEPVVLPVASGEQP